MNTRHKPTALKILAGNPGKKPLPKNEPQPNPALPLPPKNLSATQKKEWNKTAAMLHRIGVLTEADTTGFELLMRTWLRWVEAEEHVKKHGLLIVGQNGILQRNPALKIADDSLKHLEKLLGEFGMTPASRARVKATPEQKPNDEEKFFTRLA